MFVVSFASRSVARWLGQLPRRSAPVAAWLLQRHELTLLASDLRIAHFLGLHALQALPLTAWLLGHSPLLRGRGPVLAVGSLYFLAFNLLFAQAMSGRPLFSF
jgi:hypothetical protein